MRSFLISTFASTLVFATSTAHASVTCSSSHHVALNTNAIPADIVAEEIKNCSGDICASGKISQVCGSHILTITQAGNLPPAKVEDCVDQFRSIVDQCIATEDVWEGVSQTHGAEYKISLLDEIDAQNSQELHAVQARHDELGDGKLKQRQTRTKTTPKSKTQTRPKTNPKQKSRVGSKPKSTLKTATRLTPKTATKSAPTSQPTACARPTGQRGRTGRQGTGQRTGQRTARDVLEESIPQFLRRALFLRTTTPTNSRPNTPTGSRPNTPPPAESNAASCELPATDDGVDIEVLLANKVTMWTFETKPEWEKQVSAQSKARKVLTDMNEKSKLYVIELKNADVSIVGNPQDGTHPKDFEGQTGDYLLTNGGFFDRDDPNKFFSVGETSTTTKFVEIPADYKDDYEKLTGEDGSYLSAGPSLERPINFTPTKWKYKNAKGRTLAHAKVPGALAHASQPNERLVISKFANKNKYIFVYTTVSRFKFGVDTNKMRDIIDSFYQSFARTRLASASQTLNLDGGGSLYVSWNSKGGKRVIAQGDNTPEIREVTNLVKISA